MSRTIDTLIPDVYKLLETKEVPDGIDLETICDEFGREMAEVLRAQLQPEDGRRGVRLSQIGKPDRQLYLQHTREEPEKLTGPTYLKFLYGHLVEAMVLSLVRLSGHSVTDQQKQLTVEGVKGHMDCRIDGILTDVKSCSSFGFKKFRNNTLHKDDPFGYIAQLRCYAHAEGDRTYGWLAMDKQNGNLAWLQYHEDDNEGAPYRDAIQWDVPERVKHVKKLVGADLLPSVCYEPIPEGKSGNMQLAGGCRFCEHKFKCFPELKVYRYSNGPKYLTKVVREPRVKGVVIPDEF